MNNISLGKILGAICIIVFTSMYFFPFEFWELPGVNTKLILAALGLAILGFNKSKHRVGTISTNFLILSVWAIVFSLVCLFSLIYNGVWDTAYASYIMSMWVWLGGAYTIINMIQANHGNATISKIVCYLATVCIVQCLISQWIIFNPTVKEFVDSHINQGLRLTGSDRLYGIGAALDVAGSRFAAVLVMITGLLVAVKTKAITRYYLTIAFAIIVVLGSMIGRTTIVGVGLSIVVLFVSMFFSRTNTYTKNTLRSLVIVILIIVPVFVVLYNTDEQVRTNIRFGFEGFFSLVEKGRWEVHSNDILENMVKWPDNAKTWIIGDGYFNNPKKVDPYFVGKIIQGNYYMGTDIGYCRFIFYCGIIGLVAFSAFLLKAGQYCIEKAPRYTLMIVMLLAVNFIVWTKVSTDIFLVFAFTLLSDPDTDDQPTSIAQIKYAHSI